MPSPSLSTAVNTALTNTRPAANAQAPVAIEDAKVNPTDTFKDALELRKTMQPNSALTPAYDVVKVIEAAANDDDFGIASGVSGVVSQLAPTLSKGPIGVGLNMLVVGTGSRGVVQRHVDLAKDLPEITRPGGWTVDGVYRFTSLLQQVAVFWRTMGNAIYKTGMWSLGMASRLPVLAAPAGAALQSIGAVAASPVGRTLAFLNKWIPLLNAAWIIVAIKTAVDVFRDKDSSTTSKVLSIGSALTATAAVAAGFFAPGLVFVGVTAGSIFADLLLVETRFRDNRHHDTDALAVRYLIRPWEGAAAGGRWMKRVGQVIGKRLHAAWDNLTGKAKKAVDVVTPDAGKPEAPAPAPAPVAVRKPLTRAEAPAPKPARTPRPVVRDAQPPRRVAQ